MHLINGFAFSVEGDDMQISAVGCAPTRVGDGGGDVQAVGADASVVLHVEVLDDYVWFVGFLGGQVGNLRVQFRDFAVQVGDLAVEVAYLRILRTYLSVQLNNRVIQLDYLTGKASDFSIQGADLHISVAQHVVIVDDGSCHADGEDDTEGDECKFHFCGYGCSPNFIRITACDKRFPISLDKLAYLGSISGSLHVE